MAAARSASLGAKSKSQRRSPRIQHPRSLELLESRRLLSSGGVEIPAVHGGIVARPAAGAAFTGYTPAQIKKAYGFDQITADGTGQTIAIVDAFADATIVSDVAAFDTKYALPAIQLTILNENGKTDLSTYQDDPGGWDTETALDVEWAHAMAPGAKILLVETESPFTSDLMAGVNTARYIAGVSAISMSWGGAENPGGFAVNGGPADSYYDRFMVAPAGHQPETFVAASGDFGVDAASWPATSPEVLSVGGTNLKLDSSNNYVSEGVWQGSQGGESLYERTPAYQASVSKTAYRSTPDVSYDADPNTGFNIIDGGVSTLVGGTSAGSPQWAAFIADVNQVRANNGLNSLSGVNETLPALYQLALGKKTRYTNNFNDIAVGQNGDDYASSLPTIPVPLNTVPNPGGGGLTGLPAKPGYDMVTGLGTPFVPALSQYLGAFVPVKVVHRSAKRRAIVTPSAAKTKNTSLSPSMVFAAVGSQLAQVVVTPAAAPVTYTATFTPAAFKIAALSASSSASDQAVLGSAQSTSATSSAVPSETITQTRSLAADGSRLLPVEDTQATAPTSASTEPAIQPNTMEPVNQAPATEGGTIDAPATPAVAPDAPAIITEPDATEAAVLPPAVKQAVTGKYAIPMMLGAVVGDAVVVGRWLQRRAANRRKAATPFGVARVTAQDDEEGYLC